MVGNNNNQRGQRAGVWKTVGGVILALLLVGALVWAVTRNDDDKPKPAGGQTTKSASPSPSATPEDEDKFVIKLPKRDGNRLNADGVPKKIQGDGEAFREFIAEQAKRDPLTLYLYYMASPLGDKEPLKNELVLAKDGKIENGNTYSKEGVAAYERWMAIWNNPDITSVEAMKEISFQGVNTGVTKDNKPTQDASGVRGEDKSGYDIKYRDASGKVVKGHSALNRCTQPTSKVPHPDVPDGPTDNPPPPKEPKCPPDKPYGNPPKCYGPKDPAKEPSAQDNVPDQVTGQAPSPKDEHKQPTKPEDPPPTYTPPPPPKSDPPKDSTPTPQPSEPPAPGANDGDDGGEIDNPF